MDKLTVCLLSDAFPPIIDGVSNAVVNYAENIEKKWGHAMVAAPAFPGADDSKWNFQVYRYPSIDVRKITSGYMAGIPFSPVISAGLARRKVDILHAHCPMVSALLGRALYKRVNAPMIMTYHTKYDIDIANVVRSKPLQLTGIRSVVTNISSYDEVWVVSSGAGENLRSLGYQGDYIVMPNGVDLPRSRPDEETVRNDTAGFDLPENVPIFLFIGRLMWYKGLQIILDALKMLKDAGKDFRMVIVGDGGDGDEIRGYTRILGLNDKVIFTGPVFSREKIRSWYARSDLFLFPSTFDSNGLVVREAAACSVASVLIEGSCAAEDVTDGRNAFLIKENPGSLAALLTNVMDRPDIMAQTGQNAAEQLYLSWEDAVARAVERYHIVRELHESGAYREHRSFSDNLLATQGDLMYTVGQLGKAFNQSKVIAQDLFSPRDERRQRAIKNSRKIRVRKKKNRSR